MSDSADKIGSSDPETMDRTLDLESGTTNELNKPAPGTWRFPTNQDLCCIYRVPNCLRRENPEAYTPQLVLIGPLHHSLKSEALKSRGDITNAKSMGYLNTEEHKKIYLEKFAQRVEGKQIIDGFRRIIKEEEAVIRASYSESTAWIESPEFVEMILHDSVFILEHLLRSSLMGLEKIGDPLIDEPCLASTIKRDLMLLENQLPYFILEKMFDPVVKILDSNVTFRQLVIRRFIFNKDKVVINSKFSHFTDMIRLLRVETLPEHCLEVFEERGHMYNADKLHRGGVRFKAVQRSFSLYVEFDNGCLKIPTFLVDGDAEITLRNIMALEQCHYPYNAHVCNYVLFFDFLIETEKDVDLLVEKEIIKNRIGHHGAVAMMVKKLCLGVSAFGCYHSYIESQVEAHYHSRFKKSWAILKRVYSPVCVTGPAP